MIPRGIKFKTFPYSKHQLRAVSLSTLQTAMASMAARLILTWPTWMQLQVGVQLGLYGKSHIGRIPLEIRFSTYQYLCNSNLAVLHRLESRKPIPLSFCQGLRHSMQVYLNNLFWTS